MNPQSDKNYFNVMGLSQRYKLVKICKSPIQILLIQKSYSQSYKVEYIFYFIEMLVLTLRNLDFHRQNGCCDFWGETFCFLMVYFSETPCRKMGICLSSSLTIKTKYHKEYFDIWQTCSCVSILNYLLKKNSFKYILNIFKREGNVQTKSKICKDFSTKRIVWKKINSLTNTCYKNFQRKWSKIFRNNKNNQKLSKNCFKLKNLGKVYLIFSWLPKLKAEN